MIFVRTSPTFYRNNFDPTSACYGTRSSCGASASNKCGSSTKKNKCAETKTSTPKRIVVEKSPLHREEDETKTSISLDVAGFTVEQVQVQLDDHVLTVSAERTNKLGDTFVVRRRFALQADIYEEDSISATLVDGVLDLTIAKKPAPKVRHISIRTTPTETEPQVQENTEDNNDHKEAAQDSESSTPLIDAEVSLDDLVEAETVDEDEDEEDVVPSQETQEENEEEVLFDTETTQSSDSASNERHAEESWEEVVHHA